MKRIALALALAGLLGVACTGDPDEAAAPVGPPRSVQVSQSDRRPGPSSVAVMVRRVLPSVVNVRVRSFGVDAFGDPRSGSGEGTGVIIDRDGVILTNAHVVRGAVEVQVVFTDDHEPMKGRVLGLAAERDLAVVEVDARDLNPITLGHSTPPFLHLGDPVVAIGFPLGLGGPTVTKGIVSGLDRTIQVEGDSGPSSLEGLLQTDAAINPGNSGGALVNLSGNLVGINSAAALASAAENIGFAIAIDDALPVVDQIITQPPEEQAWLGVTIRSVDPVLAGQLGLPSDVLGAAVVATVPGGPAAEAGLDAGDVIVSVAGHEIASATDLTSALTELEPGEVVDVVVMSSEERRTIEVELAPRPAAFPRS